MRTRLEVTAVALVPAVLLPLGTASASQAALAPAGAATTAAATAWASASAASTASPAGVAAWPSAAGRAAARDSGYAFRLFDAQHVPVRWNPCVVHTYRVNLGGLPASTLTLVQKAVRAVAAGLGGETWRYAGPTTLVPRLDGEATRARLGADLVVAFARPGPGVRESPDLGGTTAGVGAADSSVEDLSAFSGGVVVIDSRPSMFGRMSARTRMTLLLHELGHAVGLAHTTRRSEVMYPVVSARTGWGKGDLAGLARLGRQAGCFARLPAVAGLTITSARADRSEVVARWRPVPSAAGYTVTVSTAGSTFTTRGGTSTSVAFVAYGPTRVTVQAESPHGRRYDSPGVTVHFTAPPSREPAVALS